MRERPAWWPSQEAGAAGWRPLGDLHVHRRELERSLTDLLEFVLLERDQALVDQVAVRPYGVLADELGDVLLDPRNRPDVAILHVEVKRPRDGILTGRDVLEGRLGAVDDRALDAVHVLLEEAVAEDAERVRVAAQALHDEIVVLAGLDEGAVLAHGGADLGHAGLVELCDGLRLLAAGLHDQLDEGVARAGRRRRAVDLDLRVWQRAVDVAPVLVRVRLDLAVDRHLLGQRLPELADCDLQRLRVA